MIEMKVKRLAAVVFAIALGAPQLALAQMEQESPYQRYAPIDLTGTWVSVVTEDWHVRMIPPPRGDFESIPVSPEAIEFANNVDLAQIEGEGLACQAYGAPVIMREPGRVRISWEDGDTLRVDTDAGQQTRLFHLDNVPDPGQPSRQGHSVAEWQFNGRFNFEREIRGGVQASNNGGLDNPMPSQEPDGGKLVVETSNLRAGLLRKNGIPYSADTEVTEYYNVITEPDGTEWLIVTTRVHDPEYLLTDYITSTNFQRETGNSGWNPTPCTLR